MKNYTSGVNVGTTTARIELILAKAGATRIYKEFKDGEIEAMSFCLAMPNGKDVSIRLPANAAAVERVLLAQVKRPQKETIRRISDQARRTAWKIMQDWIEVQVSLIEMEQVEPLQVFLPYIWDGTRTYFAALKETGFKMLTAGERSKEKS